VVSGLPPEGGGLTVAVLEIARWQCILGHACTILTGSHHGPKLPSSMTDLLSEAGVLVSEFPVRGPDKFRYLLNFRKFLEQEGRSFDLFVLHGSYQYATFAAAAFCQKARIPYIFTPHGSLDPAVRRKHSFRNRLVDFSYHDRVIRPAVAWHFTSEEERSDCERQVWSRSSVEPLGIDVDRIPVGGRTGKFRKRYEVPADAMLFLFLSRITRKKGIGILIEAFRRLTVDNPNVFLALCGPVDEDMRGILREALDDGKLGRRLIVTGLVLGDNKDEAFFDSDCFVLPTYSENFGIAAFEALAYGLPLLTTTGMNLHREITASGRAIVVSPDAVALHSALLNFVNSKWSPTASPEEVRIWLQNKFAWRVRAENLIGHYVAAM
jgi:glycosyltransferase involved in cell wall biosynthesis